MTYAEYTKLKGAHESAICRKKSLLMTIRMNKAWDINAKGSEKQVKRQAIIDKAEKELACLVMPPKPTQPIGYEVLVDGSYEGFISTDDIDSAREQAIEYLGHENFTLKAKARFQD